MEPWTFELLKAAYEEAAPPGRQGLRPPTTNDEVRARLIANYYEWRNVFIDSRGEMIAVWLAIFEPEELRPICDDVLQRLWAFGEFWTGPERSWAPIQTWLGHAWSVLLWCEAWSRGWAPYPHITDSELASFIEARQREKVINDQTVQLMLAV